MLVPVMQFVEEQLKSKKAETSVVGFPKWKCIILVLPEGVTTVVWISAYFCLWGIHISEFSVDSLQTGIGYVGNSYSFNSFLYSHNI